MQGHRGGEEAYEVSVHWRQGDSCRGVFFLSSLGVSRHLLSFSRPLKDLNVKYLRARQGIVSQEPKLFSVSVSFLPCGRKGRRQTKEEKTEWEGTETEREKNGRAEGRTCRGQKHPSGSANMQTWTRIDPTHTYMHT